MTFPCETLLGAELPGEKRPGNWTVIEKIERKPDSSGGNFSVGYIARHADGTEAFLKATDIGLLTRVSPGTKLEKMAKAVKEQQFERTILDICRGNNLDRVVHAIDYGELETEHEGFRDVIFYIIFEKAEGDVRTQISRDNRLNLSWSLHALFNLANAIQQLHQQLIAHNDIKPSNFLVFDDFLQKLADVGRAVAVTTDGPWDERRLPGDFTYAAPEFWYPRAEEIPAGTKIPFSIRRASDLFHLGSMAYFLVTGEKLTPLMQTFLRPEHNSMNWTGAYEEVLPFVRDAFGQCLTILDTALPTDSNGQYDPEAINLKAAIVQLCEPDPKKRGHPLNFARGQDQYGLERYLSLFDHSAKSLRIRERMR